MLQAFSVLKSPITHHRRVTESYVFYLHYRVTCLILMFCCLVISSTQLVGDRIHCMPTQGTDVSVRVLDAYCWATSTHSVSSAYFKEAGVEVPYPGVGSSEDESEYTYRNYYQYIHLVLFLQALLFYVPHLIWKSIDKNYMTNFLAALNAHSKPKEEEDDDEPSFDAQATFIEQRWGTHKQFTLSYLFCELLSLVNLTVQTLLLNWFLQGEFFGLGHFYSAYYTSKGMQDPIHLFPLVTSCYFRKFGASGVVDVVDALCVLPVNAINVKIYLFVWAWFAVLTGLSLLNMFNLCLACLVPRYRLLSSTVATGFFRDNVDLTHYHRVATKADYGDWFVLEATKGSMDSLHFFRLAESLSNKLQCLDTEKPDP